MKELDFCQSCGMPMNEDTGAEDFYGLNADGSKNKEYCKYCFDKGHFIKEETMEEMIETCIPFMVNGGMEAGQARDLLEKQLPNLKRWKKNI